jgi:hypothetical protein
LRGLRSLGERVQPGSALSIAVRATTSVSCVVNGISMTGESGTTFIANWSMLGLITTLRNGLYNAANGY